jgi:glucose-1-phosphate thymidylyltransferase
VRGEVDVKGIILAGGNGTRLHPVTLGTSKQLLPVYNKPLVFYPLSVLMLAGVREVLLICSPDALDAFQRTLGTGAVFGLDISYSVQPEPRGIVDALIIGAEHVGEDSVALILGDNIFYGHGLSDLLTQEAARVDGCTLFGYRVADPHRYGVGEADGAGRLLHLEEKPARPRSDLAITGLYLYEPGVIDVAARCVPPPGGSWRSPMSTACTWSSGELVWWIWAAGSPGSTRAPLTPCSKPAASCRFSNSGRGLASPAWKRSP